MCFRISLIMSHQKLERTPPLFSLANGQSTSRGVCGVCVVTSLLFVYCDRSLCENLGASGHTQATLCRFINDFLHRTLCQYSPGWGSMGWRTVSIFPLYSIHAERANLFVAFKVDNERIVCSFNFRTNSSCRADVFPPSSNK